VGRALRGTSDVISTLDTVYLPQRHISDRIYRSSAHQHAAAVGGGAAEPACLPACDMRHATCATTSSPRVADQRAVKGAAVLLPALHQSRQGGAEPDEEAQRKCHTWPRTRPHAQRSVIRGRSVRGACWMSGSSGWQAGRQGQPPRRCGCGAPHPSLLTDREATEQPLSCRHGAAVRRHCPQIEERRPAEDDRGA
jgi:hypothetical protein